MASMTSLTFVSDETIELTGSAIARILGVTFSKRNSLYRGGDYLVAGNPDVGERLFVQGNDDLDDVAVTGESRSATIVYVEGTTRPDHVLATFVEAGFRLVGRADTDSANRP